MKPKDSEKLGTGNSELVRTFSTKGANQGANFNEKVRTYQTSLKNNDLLKNEIWLTVKEAANLLGTTKRAIQKKIKSGHFVIREVWGNGGKRYEIALSSLPVEAQARYWAERQKSSEGILHPAGAGLLLTSNRN